MTTIELIPRALREQFRPARPTVARLRRHYFRSRRKAQAWADNVAELLRPISIDSQDHGRLVAGMTLSSSFMALLLFLAAVLIATTYGR